MKRIDCRNMACPLPVVTVKRALEEASGGIEVLLDAGAPRENVSRFVASRGYAVEESPEGDGYLLKIGAKPSPDQAPNSASAGSVMLIASDRLGDGPEELGRLLMKNFIMTLLDTDQLPDRIFFANAGVLLTTEGSEVQEALEKLGDRGVEVLSCGMCLDYFNRRKKLVAGEVTNMLTIAEALLGPAKVVRL